METRDHWNAVYQSKSDDQVSWTEAVPDVSLQMLEAAGMDAETCVVDIGGGNSRLVDELVERGLSCLAVLDVAPAAVERVKHRLGARADVPTWIIGDVTGIWSLKPMDIRVLGCVDPRRVCALSAHNPLGRHAIVPIFAVREGVNGDGLPARTDN